VDTTKYNHFYRVMLSASTLVDSGVVPGNLELNKNAVSLRAWSMGREAARHGLKAEANALFTLGKNIILSRADRGNLPMIALGRLIGSYRAERTLLAIKMMARTLSRLRHAH